MINYVAVNTTPSLLTVTGEGVLINETAQDVYLSTSNNPLDSAIILASNTSITWTTNKPLYGWVLSGSIKLTFSDDIYGYTVSPERTAIATATAIAATGVSVNAVTTRLGYYVFNNAVGVTYTSPVMDVSKYQSLSVTVTPLAATSGAAVYCEIIHTDDLGNFLKNETVSLQESQSTQITTPIIGKFVQIVLNGPFSASNSIVIVDGTSRALPHAVTPAQSLHDIYAITYSNPALTTTIQYVTLPTYSGVLYLNVIITSGTNLDVLAEFKALTPATYYRTNLVNPGVYNLQIPITDNYTRLGFRMNGGASNINFSCAGVII